MSTLSREDVLISWLRRVLGTDRVNLSAPELEPGETYLVARITPVDLGSRTQREPIIELNAIAATSMGALADWEATEQLCQHVESMTDTWDRPVYNLRISGQVVSFGTPTVRTRTYRQQGADGPGVWASHFCQISVPFQI